MDFMKSIGDLLPIELRGRSVLVTARLASSPGIGQRQEPVLIDAFASDY